ncbi:odorant receptor 10-like [Rhynchophorus ferrugineus]|uniref:odorant receptor 10-like n=1 Tax=Rhynchophorus ferrugineus TaxID=354439 RepID=UPI003FCDB7EA
MSNEKILYKTNDWDAIECYLGYVRSLKFKLITLFITTMKTCITFILIEVCNNIENNKIHVAKNETIESPLLYPLYIPYYSMTEQNVEVLYILNTFVALLVILGVNVTFGFSITFMTYAAARLGVLCIRLRRLKDIAITSYGGDINLALKILIMEHQHLIGFIRILNDKISMITFAEFLFSSINCALVIVNAIKADTLTISSMYSLGYMTLLIEQIFFYASSANEIKLQSIAIIDACYESDWNTFDEETKKMLLIVMMKAYKPIEMSIGPFSSMTNETALMMMKACYSYVAFIKDSTI